MAHFHRVACQPFTPQTPTVRSPLEVRRPEHPDQDLNLDRPRWARAHNPQVTSLSILMDFRFFRLLHQIGPFRYFWCKVGAKAESSALLFRGPSGSLIVGRTPRGKVHDSRLKHFSMMSVYVVHG
jgi:hypothetical protein